MSDADDSGNAASATRHGRCPICRAPGDADYRPFCSKRCANIDLARWLGGTYVIPGGADVDEDGDGERQPVSPDPGEKPDADA